MPRATEQEAHVSTTPAGVKNGFTKRTMAVTGAAQSKLARQGAVHAVSAGHPDTLGTVGSSGMAPSLPPNEAHVPSISREIQDERNESNQAAEGRTRHAQLPEITTNTNPQQEAHVPTSVPRGTKDDHNRRTLAVEGQVGAVVLERVTADSSRGKGNSSRRGYQPATVGVKSR